METRRGRVGLTAPQLAYEPKYDGLRIVSEFEPHAVVLRSRDGNVKNNQFPEVLEALKGKFRTGTALDGEIVALRKDGTIGTFQELQPLMNAGRRRFSGDISAAYTAFDILEYRTTDVTMHSLKERRAFLEAVMDEFNWPASCVRLAEHYEGKGWGLYKRAIDQGWEGLMAKKLGGSYMPGARSHNWLKLKLHRRQEFVVGGWTEPKGGRQHFGALMVGYYDGKKLVPCGGVGSGFGAGWQLASNQEPCPIGRPRASTRH